MEPDSTDNTLASLRSFLEDLRNALTIARGLVEDGHVIDLTGFDSQVGLLCAKALDLPPEQGRALRADLVTLLGAVTALTGALGAGRRA